MQDWYTWDPPVEEFKEVTMGRERLMVTVLIWHLTNHDLNLCESVTFLTDLREIPFAFLMTSMWISLPGVKQG